jgi:hypothetical protein
VSFQNAHNVVCATYPRFLHVFRVDLCRLASVFAKTFMLWSGSGVHREQLIGLPATLPVHKKKKFHLICILFLAETRTVIG